MDSPIIYIMLFIIALGGIAVGIASVSGATLPSFSMPSLDGGLFASAYAAVETTFGSKVNQGSFLISFDNFSNIFSTTLDNKTSVSVFDVDGFFPVDGTAQRIYMSTDRGLFLSNDGGLTFNRFTTSNNEIAADSIVYKVLPASSNGEDYFIAVYTNGKGTLYRTYDYFFHLEKLIDFDKESVYDMSFTGNSLYFSLSTGQLIHYTLSNNEMRVVTTFSSPIVRIMKAPSGVFYLLSKSGTVYYASTLEGNQGKFKTLKGPSSGFLSFFFPFLSSSVKSLDFDGAGALYALNAKGIWRTQDNGSHWKLLSTLPVPKKKISAMGVHNGIVYAASENRAYVSKDFGTNWKVYDLSNPSLISNFFFVNQRIIMGM